MDESGTIRIQGLEKRYRSGTMDLCVFANLNLEIEAGERVSLTGESGAGKSTLLYLMGCLDRPSAGSIRLNGQELTTLNDDGLAEVRNRRIGFVWQSQTLLNEFTALENVMMPLLIRGTSHTNASKVASQRLYEVGLTARAHHLGGELSGGEQQRVVLARALAGDPQFLLADEPTGNLDSRNGELMMDLLEEVHKQNRLTTIYITHNPEFARRAERTLALREGRLEPGRPGVPSGEGRSAMFERYTEKARRVIFFSRYEAGFFGERAIETQHLLLGWLREEKKLATRFLGSQAELESFRTQIESRTNQQSPTPTSVDLPLSADCKRVLMNAAEESDQLKHKHIGTHHLLLGMLREEQSLAAHLLGERGLKLSEVREEIRRLEPASDGELGDPAGA